MCSDATQTNPLGKTVKYPNKYDPKLLYSILRQEARNKLGLTESLPFMGQDVWNAYEVSWLDAKGMPRVVIAQFTIPCTSPYIIESKSFKLYLNSFNQQIFQDQNEVLTIMKKDLSEKADAAIEIQFYSPDKLSELGFCQPSGECLDELDVTTNHYQRSPELLTTNSTQVAKTVYSHLFRSNCPITNQPDWASVFINYQGNEIEPHGLLQYLISYRNEHDFHENCVEQIFVDLLEVCQPDELSVQAFFLRRGGLDINPFRATTNIKPKYFRLSRQ